MTRYAVELLFEFDKKFKGMSIQKRKICEYKTMVFYADSNEEAYHYSLQLGKDEEFSFADNDYDIFYNFIGIIELISLEDEDENVVWWYFGEKLNPQQKKENLIPKKGELKIFQPISGKRKVKLLSKRSSRRMR